MSAAGEQEEWDLGSYAEHSPGECGATGLYWSLPGGWEGQEGCGCSMLSDNT